MKQDERALFEAWADDQGYPMARLHEGEDVYKDLRTEGAWITWQARAALAAKPKAQVQELAKSLDGVTEKLDALCDGLGISRLSIAKNSAENIRAYARSMLPPAAQVQEGV